MARVALAGLRAHPARLLLTALAIMAGVSFLAGSLVYGDTARAAFYDDLARSARGVDALAQSGPVLIDRETVDEIRALPGVAAVDPRIVGPLGVLDRNGRLLVRDGHVGYGLSLPGDPRMARYDLLTGRLPGAPGEIAIDKLTAGEQGWKAGDTVRVTDRTGAQHSLALVGIVDLGVNRIFSGSPAGVLTDAELARLTGTTRYMDVAIAAQPGVSQAALRARVDGVLAGPHRVITGDQYRGGLAWRAGKYVDGFLSVLIAFGLVALVVSGYVIYNTFTILTAQRAAELALLRCAGAGRAQVWRVVTAEALVLGALASLGGVVLSLVVGWGLLVSRELVGTQIPGHDLVLGWRTVVLTVAFGTAVTLLGALLPALSAGRIPPVAAIRASAATEYKISSSRVVTAWACGLAGLGSTLLGLRGGFGGLPFVLGGAMLVFLGFAAAAPALIKRLVGAGGWLPGVTARLAVANARRNPRRTAATATALMIGVTLMALFSVLLSTARVQAGSELRENFRVDFRLAPASATGTVAERERIRPTIPEALITALRQRPEIESVAGVRSSGPVWAMTPPGVFTPEITEGLLDLRPGTVAVSRRTGLHVGETYRDLTVVATYDDSPVDADALVSWEQYAESYGPGEAHQVLVNAPREARTVIEEVASAYPLIQVSAGSDRADALSASLNELLGIFAALLGMSVLIALFGISNTLALSIVERTRESATLRALGLSRRQLRGMLLAEAGLIGAAGALSGVLFGAAVGWLAALALISRYGHGTPTVPFGQLAVIGLAAVLTAVLAAAITAGRAARKPIVTGLSAP